MTKHRHHCFISSLTQAIILKKIFKSYVSEKKSSVKGTEKPHKKKSVERHKKSTRKNSFYDSVLAEDTIHNFAIKSVLGFLGGILLTYTCFMFFVFSLNFTLKRATIICMGLGIILSLGLAFSVKIRCTVFLCIPQLFSKRGRQALLAYAFILALSGPAKNTLHNVEVMSESLACGQEQIKQAENELVNCVQKPNTIAKKAIEKLLEKLNPAVKFYKHFILQLYRTCYDILETFFYGQKWLSSIFLLCEEKFANPSERCEKFLKESIRNCKNTSSSMNWENLCELNLAAVKQICYVKNNQICPSVDDFEHMSIPRLKQRLDGFKQRAINVLYVKVEGQQTHIQQNRTNNFHEEYQGMATEIRQKTDQFLQYFDFMSVIFGIFILVLFVKVIIYRHKFLTEDQYDNRFITRDFEDIDITRGEFNMETILPLTTREKTKYIKVTSIRLIPCEKVRLLSSFVFLIFATFKIIIHMLTDSSLYWILSSVRRDERLLYMNTLKEDQPTMTVRVLGQGAIAALVQNITKAVERQYNSQDLDPTPCLPDPVPPDFNRYYQITLVLICWLLALFEPYGLRLRHTVMVTYHPDRARERAIWLYNCIMRNRTVYVNEARKELRRKYRCEPGDTLCRLLIDKELKSKPTTCLLCKAKVFGDDFYKCPTVNCVGTYCWECYALLKFCSICRDAKEFEDLTYTSEEMDSSDEGSPSNKNPCTCKKKEKFIRHFTKREIENYRNDEIFLKVKKFYFFDENRRAKTSEPPPFQRAMKFIRNKFLNPSERRAYASDQESSDWDFEWEISSSANEGENKAVKRCALPKKFGKTFEKNKEEVKKFRKEKAKTRKIEKKFKKFGRGTKAKVRDESETFLVEPEERGEKGREGEGELEKKGDSEKEEDAKKIVKFNSKKNIKIGRLSDIIEKHIADAEQPEIKGEKKVFVDNAEQEYANLGWVADDKKEEKRVAKEKGSEDFEKIITTEKKSEYKKDKSEEADSEESKQLKSSKSKWNLDVIKKLSIPSLTNLKRVDKQTSISMFKKEQDEQNESLPIEARKNLKENQTEVKETQTNAPTCPKYEKFSKKMMKLLKRDFQKNIKLQLPKHLQPRKVQRKIVHDRHSSFERQIPLQFNPDPQNLQCEASNKLDYPSDPKYNLQYDTPFKSQCRYDSQWQQLPYKSQYEPSNQPQPQLQPQLQPQTQLQPQLQTQPQTQPQLQTQPQPQYQHHHQHQPQFNSPRHHHFRFGPYHKPLFRTRHQIRHQARHQARHQTQQDESQTQPRFTTPCRPRFGLQHAPRFGTQHLPRFGLKHVPRFGVSRLPRFVPSHLPQFGLQHRSHQDDPQHQPRFDAKNLARFGPMHQPQFDDPQYQPQFDEPQYQPQYDSQHQPRFAPPNGCMLGPQFQPQLDDYEQKCRLGILIRPLNDSRYRTRHGDLQHQPQNGSQRERQPDDSQDQLRFGIPYQPQHDDLPNQLQRDDSQQEQPPHDSQRPPYNDSQSHLQSGNQRFGAQIQPRFSPQNQSQRDDPLNQPQNGSQSYSQSDTQHQPRFGTQIQPRFSPQNQSQRDDPLNQPQNESQPYRQCDSQQLPRFGIQSQSPFANKTNLNVPKNQQSQSDAQHWSESSMSKSESQNINSGCSPKCQRKKRQLDSEPCKEANEEDDLDKKENFGNDPNLPSKQKKKDDNKDDNDVGSVRSLVMNVTETIGHPLPLEKMIYMNYPELKDIDEYNTPARRTTLRHTECVDIPSAEGSECLLGFFKNPEFQCPLPDEDFICINPQKSLSECGNIHACRSNHNCFCDRHLDENFPCFSQENICRRHASDSNLGSICSSSLRRSPGCMSLDSAGPSRVPSVLGLDNCSSIRRAPGSVNFEKIGTPELKPYSFPQRDISKFSNTCDPCREFGIKLSNTPQLNTLDYSTCRSPEPDDAFADSVPLSVKLERLSEMLRNLDSDRFERRRFEGAPIPSPEPGPSYLYDSPNVRSPKLCRNLSPPEPRSPDSFDYINLRGPGLHGNFNLESDYHHDLGKREHLPPLIRPPELASTRTRRKSTGQVTFAPEISKPSGAYGHFSGSSDDDCFLAKPAKNFYMLSVSEPDDLEIENLLTHSYGEKHSKRMGLSKTNPAKTYKKTRDTEFEGYHDTSDVDDVENPPHPAAVFLSDKEFEKLSQSLLKEKEKAKPQLTWAPDLISDLPGTSKPKDNQKSS